MTKQEPGICPVCGRFVGPANVCPYCDTDGISPSPVSLIRWGSLFTSLAGIAFLWLMARNTKPNMIRVCDISPKTRLAQVAIAGLVERRPSVKRGSDAQTRLSFQVDDGSGSIIVVAKGVAAKRLMERYGTPACGKFVTVQGTLDTDRYGRWLLRPSAWIQAPPAVEEESADVECKEGALGGPSASFSCGYPATDADLLDGPPR